MKAGESPANPKRPRRSDYVVYWDSCVLIAWMKDEKRAAGEMEGIEAVVKLLEAKKASIITSVLTRTEVLRGKHDKATTDKYRRIFRRSNVQHVAVDYPIAELASEIRDFYHKQNIDIKTPDAIHLATAIHYDAAEMQTFDGADTSKADGLLRLDGDVAGRTLRIRKPDAPQGSLLTGVPALEDNEQTKQTADTKAAQLPGGGDGPSKGTAAAEGQAEAEEGKEGRES